MNVNVRSVAGTVLVALAASVAPVAAQSAPPAGLDEVSVANAANIPVQAGAESVRQPAPSVATTPAVDASSKPATRGPRIASARVATHAASAPIGAPPVIQNRSSNRNAVALMAVGGAALVVGAVIGEDAGTLVMLGGAVIGLYGLYLFLT
jgi:hypothetical protein